MKKVIIHFIVLCFILPASLKIYSQDITIDSIFRSSFEIFPFDKIESISSMSIEGEVYLNTDTSLVRVLLEDESGVQYMILEFYPLICPGLYQNFSTHCDETCLLEQTNPY